MDDMVNTHRFVFNKRDGGGEELSLETRFLHNGDGEDGIYLNQTLKLHSYCNSASFELTGAKLTPDSLRELANELDKAMLIAKHKAVAVVPTKDDLDDAKFLEEMACVK